MVVGARRKHGVDWVGELVASATCTSSCLFRRPVAHPPQFAYIKALFTQVCAADYLVCAAFVYLFHVSTDLL